MNERVVTLWELRILSRALFANDHATSIHRCVDKPVNKKLQNIYLSGVLFVYSMWINRCVVTSCQMDVIGISFSQAQVPLSRVSYIIIYSIVLTDWIDNSPYRGGGASGVRVLLDVRPLNIKECILLPMSSGETYGRVLYFICDIAQTNTNHE